MDFYQNLIEQKKKHKLNNIDLGQIIELSGDALRMALKRKSLSTLQIKEIEKYFDTLENTEQKPNKDFYADPNSEQLVSKAGNSFDELPNGKFRIWTKKVPVKAFASYISEFRNVAAFDDLEEVPWIIDHFARGRYLTFETEGESMNGGGLYDAPGGADLLGRELQKHHWKDGFRESIYGWVIVHKDTMVYKDIIDFNQETGDIVCHSRSGLPQHPDFTINLNDVLEIWKVIKRTF